MPDPSLNRIADFFTKPHMLPGGDPEPVTAKAPPSGMPGGPPIPLPPILEGVYRTLYPTPAETGELPPQLYPGTPGAQAVQPTGASVANSIYPQG